jgi:sulfatase maturation enzyme AslB (radical SAM superfamily)
MTIAPPTHILWDITYTCPLRCTHCYSESGRRPSRQLSHEDILRVADRIISLRPEGVGLAGGEGLVVKGVFEAVDRLISAGIEVYLYTSGWPLRGASMLGEIMRLRPRVHVSVDGATPEVHDRIRGRAGAFDRAMQALRLLDDAARESRLAGGPPLEFGIDATIVRSSFPQLEDFCTDLAPRFPEMRFLSLSAVVPSGLASRTGFVRHELLADEQADAL